jgi:hypothetical protein
MVTSSPRNRGARRYCGEEGHLTGVDYPGTTNDDEHQYDGGGRRMRSKLAGAANWTEFVHDELTGEILMEYTLVGGVFTIKAVNTWGLGLISTNREGTKGYFHFDGLGSTRALTDSSETVTDTYEYNAFGVLESSTGTSVNPFRYVGQYGYYDDGAMGSASGLMCIADSFYLAGAGRFLGLPYVTELTLQQQPKKTVKNGDLTCYNQTFRNCCTACGKCFTEKMECGPFVARLGGAPGEWQCGDVVECCVRVQGKRDCKRFTIIDTGRATSAIIDLGCCYAQKIGWLPGGTGRVRGICTWVGHRDITRECRNHDQCAPPAGRGVNCGGTIGAPEGGGVL